MKIYEHDYSTYKCKYNPPNICIAERCKYCSKVEEQLEDYKGGGMVKVILVDCEKEKVEKMKEILK